MALKATKAEVWAVTIEDRGLDAFCAEVEKRAGVKLEAAKPFEFTSLGDRYGWTEGENGKSHLTLYVPNGRIRDEAGGAAMLSGLWMRSSVSGPAAGGAAGVCACAAADERNTIVSPIAKWRTIVTSRAPR